jgi:hypothetical protein
VSLLSLAKEAFRTPLCKLVRVDIFILSSLTNLSSSEECEHPTPPQRERAWYGHEMLFLEQQLIQRWLQEEEPIIVPMTCKRSAFGLLLPFAGDTGLHKVYRSIGCGRESHASQQQPVLFLANDTMRNTLEQYNVIIISIFMSLVTTYCSNSTPSKSVLKK